MATSKCKRCGRCCEKVGIGYSPKELKQGYFAWLYQDNAKMLKKHRVEHVQRMSEIFLLYPMLTYIGKSHTVNWYYYRCKHFIRDKKGRGVCTINDIKPDMCADFPYYRGYKNVRIGQAPDAPSSYKGCGYNRR